MNKKGIWMLRFVLENREVYFCAKTIISMKAYPHFQHTALTSKIIEAAYYVHEYLGFGHLESVYERALEIKLKEEKFIVERQISIQVFFQGIIVGDFRADLIVENLVIIELKAVEKIHPIHEVQLVNYLKCTELEVGLILNFGEKLEIKRKVFSNSRKQPLQS